MASLPGGPASLLHRARGRILVSLESHSLWVWVCFLCPQYCCQIHYPCADRMPEVPLTVPPCLVPGSGNVCSTGGAEQWACAQGSHWSATLAGYCSFLEKLEVLYKKKKRIFLEKLAILSEEGVTEHPREVQFGMELDRRPQGCQGVRCMMGAPSLLPRWILLASGTGHAGKRVELGCGRRGCGTVAGSPQFL